MYVSQKAEEAIGQKYRTIFLVKDDIGDSYMIDGWVIEKDRVDVFYDESEYNAIYQELLQRREEVAELMKRLDQMKEDRALLMREIDELTRERKELLETIERAVDERKVVLPTKVAFALDKLLEEFGRKGTLEALFNPGKVDQYGFAKWRTAELKRLISVVNAMEFDDILDALVNGYTSKNIEEQVSHMLHEWLEADYQGDEETDRRTFAKKLVEYIKGELAQSG